MALTQIPRDVVSDVFRTPHGQRAEFWIRTNTNDWNVVNACTAVGNEYHMPTGLSGWALDVGAHIGAVAVTLLLDNPDLRCVAIEALPENAELLRRNLVHNGVAGRCVVIEGGAGDGAPVRIGYGNVTDESGIHEYIGNATAPEGSREVTVAGVTLIDVLWAICEAEHGPTSGAHPFHEIGWAKLDAEGAEFPFLGSGRDFLQDIAHIEGEVHPLAPDGTKGGADRLLDILGPTHDVAFPGYDANPDFGPFVAVRR